MMCYVPIPKQWCEGFVPESKKLSAPISAQGYRATNAVATEKLDLFGIVIIRYPPEKILFTSVISPVLQVSFQILSSHNKLQRRRGLFSRQEKRQNLSIYLLFKNCLAGRKHKVLILDMMLFRGCDQMPTLLPDLQRCLGETNFVN